MKMNQQKLTAFSRRLAVCFVMLSWTASCTLARGQVAIPDPFGVSFSSFGYAMEVKETGGRVELPGSELPEPLTPEQQAALESVQAYMGIEAIARTPSTILQQLAKRGIANAKLPSADESADAEAEQQRARIAELESQLISGDWAGVKTHLASLPELAAPFVYSHIVNLLTQGKSIRPEEIPAIADAAPGELTARQCSQLGALLSASLVHLDQPRVLLQAIASGTGRLGGTDPQGRANAARVLLAAGLIDEAAKYVATPSDIGTDTPFDILDLCSLLEFARYQQHADDQTLAKAWSYTVAAWSAKSARDVQRNAVVPRLVILVSAQSAEQARAWIKKIALEDRMQTNQFMAKVLQQAETAYVENDEAARVAILKVTGFFGNALSELNDTAADTWKQELQLLVVPWLNEALKATDDKKRLIIAPDDSEVGVVGEELLGQTAPSTSWLEKLPTDTAAMARRLKGLIGARNAAWDTVQEAAAALADYDPKLAQSVIDSYLGITIHHGADVSDRLNEVMQQLQGQGYSAAQLAHYRQYYCQQLMEEGEAGEGIALTRASQVQSLKKLHELLKTLASLKLPAPSADAVSNAFIAAHSSAEVFRREDVETVFGPLTELSAESTTSLGQKMRECLAQRWRDQRVQQAAGTNRNASELSQEVVRGYELAIEMVESHVQENAENVQLQLLAGLLIFDQSEFLYGLRADLPTYVTLRDRAFARIQQAADCYAKTLALPNAEPNIEVFQRWFQVALGASDLAYLTRQSTADEPQLQKLATSIRSLGDPRTDKHLAMFGAALEEELDNVPPALKQRCMRESLVVLGDHPAGKKARELNEYYQQLLEEVELHTAVDGSQQVGHGKPFGMQLSVRYSTPLGREANDFVSLIDKQYDPSGSEVDNKEKLEEEIRTKLSESFVIEELRFHPPTVKRSSYGREGWHETPLAYLVLSAKDPAIDTIAPLQVDVLFRDGHGSVLLPIASQKLLIDAREKQPAQRPLADLKVKQLLDARELNRGEMRLELVASGIGLVPELSRLADIQTGGNVSGFRVKAIEDHGVSIMEFDTSRENQPVSERTWIVSLEVVEQSGISVVDRFEFPKIVVDEANVTYEQFADADIVAATSVVPLQAFVAYDRTRLAVTLAVGVLSLLGLTLGGAWLWRHNRVVYERPVYRVPAKLTPFSLVAFLRRIAGDQRLSLAAADQESLQATIADLEARFFSDQNDIRDDAELRKVFDRWNAKAQKQFSRVAEATVAG